MTYTAMKFLSFLMVCGVAELSAQYGQEFPACPHGWENSEAGSCYEFNEAVKSWNDARADCHHKGAELAQVTSLSKADSLANLRFRIGNQHNYYWVGACQNSVGSKDFSWVSGGAFSTSLWFPGEPNNHRAYDLQCVDMCSVHQHMKMCDWSCSLGLSYICEKQLLAA